MRQPLFCWSAAFHLFFRLLLRLCIVEWIRAQTVFHYESIHTTGLIFELKLCAASEARNREWLWRDPELPDLENSTCLGKPYLRILSYQRDCLYLYYRACRAPPGQAVRPATTLQFSPTEARTSSRVRKRPPEAHRAVFRSYTAGDVKE